MDCNRLPRNVVSYIFGHFTIALFLGDDLCSSVPRIPCALIGWTVNATNMISSAVPDSVNNNAIVSFDAFVKEYNLYPHSAFSTFHIVRDIMIKQEVREIALEDGAEHGMDGYLIRCVTKLAECKRVIVPYSADQEIDLLRHVIN